MSAWSLPTSVTVSGREYIIRSDFRAVLDAIGALQDADLSDQERAAACLMILFPDWESLPDASAALQAAMTFVNCGQPVRIATKRQRPILIDWERDVSMIAPAVDKVLGYSCRRCRYLHWWEFIGAFGNVGDGQFAQVINIRNKKARGKKLDKAEQEFARDNAELVSLPKSRLTEEEEAFFRSLGV